MHLLVTFYENVLLCLDSTRLDSTRRCSLHILPGCCCCCLCCLSCAVAGRSLQRAHCSHFGPQLTHTYTHRQTIDKYLHVSCRFLPMLFTIKISRKLHILLGLCCAASPTHSGQRQQHWQWIVAKIFALHARTHTHTHTHRYHLPCAAL